MSGGTFLIVAVAAILAVICGWLVPILFKSRRPFGLLGDVLVCTVVTVVLAYVEWVWILPALGFGDGLDLGGGGHRRSAGLGPGSACG